MRLSQVRFFVLIHHVMRHNDVGTRISVENTDESTSGPGPFSYLLPRPSCRDRYQPLPHVQCDLAVTIPHVKKCDLAVTLRIVAMNE